MANILFFLLLSSFTAGFGKSQSTQLAWNFNRLARHHHRPGADCNICGEYGFYFRFNGLANTKLRKGNLDGQEKNAMRKLYISFMCLFGTRIFQWG